MSKNLIVGVAIGALAILLLKGRNGSTPTNIPSASLPSGVDDFQVARKIHRFDVVRLN